MFVKITTSGPRKYVKLVEAFRDDNGVVRQRVVATLGRLEQIQSGKGDALLNGLLRASGKPTLAEGTGAVAFAPSVSVGDTWLLHTLWHELGLGDAFRRALRRHRRQFDAEHLLRVMVFNRLCDPESKLGILRWLEGTRVPQVDASTVTHQHLLRTMDTLNACTGALESALSKQLRPLIDQELSVVFYDLTSIRTEGRSQSPEEIRRYGPSKDGGIARQVMLGVVQTAEGLPIHHEVFEGNAAETRTLVPTIEKVLKRYPIQRVVLVADRGLLSLDNLTSIREIKIGDRPLEFILAVPARRYGDFEDILGAFHRTTCSQATEEVRGEFRWQDYRLIVAHRPDLAQEQSQRRDEQIAALNADAARWTGKLDAQDEGKRCRGRKLSDAGVTARFYKAVSDARLARIIKVDLSSDVFCYDVDARLAPRSNARRQADPGHQHGRPLPGADRRTLQGVGGHRTRVPGAEIRDRDRPGVPLACGSNSCTRTDLFPGARALPGLAHALEGSPQPLRSGTRPRDHAPHPVPPGHATPEPDRLRTLDLVARTTRSL
jgi:hypothetical protein